MQIASSGGQASPLPHDSDHLMVREAFGQAHGLEGENIGIVREIHGD